MNCANVLRCLVGMAILTTCGRLSAAPLTWFPGPPLTVAGSGEATTTLSDGYNLVIGGDVNYYAEGLGATNSNWTIYAGGLFSTATIGAGAAGSGDPILFFGGTDGTTPTSAVFGYSPSGDGQTTLASMSTARAYFGYVTDKSGNAYAIGGLDAANQPLASGEYYNQDTLAWSAITAMSSKRYDFPAVYDHTNLIYVFGGRTTAGGAPVATVLRYSISGKSWSTLASLPVAVAGSTATYGSDGNIYVVGGVAQGGTTNVVQVYNPAANSWTISTPLPESLSASVMGVDSMGRLIVMGGMDGGSNDVADVWRSQQLNQPDTVPVFTQYPGVTNGYYLKPYSDSVSATGNPQPTFVLANGPAGMQVDTYSGAITWTPQGNQIGTNSVTIRATNYAGYVDYTYSVYVPYPPPSLPTNLTVVSESDNSVTLSVGPQSYVVGNLTYNLYIPHPYHSPRGSGGGVNYQLIASNLPGATFTITGLNPGTGYSYDMTATGPGGTSGYAGIGFATTAPQTPPNVQLVGLTSTSFTFTWSPSPGPAQSPNYSPISSYAIVQYAQGVGPNSTLLPNLTAIPTNVFTGTVTGLKPGSAAFWEVQAIDNQGYGSSTYNIFTISQPVPAAASLSNSVVSSVGNGKGFQFTASEGGSVLQTVYIQATTNPADPNSWTQIGSILPTANPFTFIDTNASLYPTRFYRVAAP